jgi:hypothetical protein
MERASESVHKPGGRDVIELPELLAGVYRHYKGPLYQVLGYAHDANAEDLADYPAMMERVYAHNRGDVGVPDKPTPLGERVAVVYFGLTLDAAHTGPRLAVRSYDDFFAWVHPFDGSRCWTHVGESNTYCQCTGYTHIDVPDRRAVQRFTYVEPAWTGEV